MEGFQLRGWYVILPGCGGTSTLSRGASLAARWLHQTRPIRNPLVVMGYPNHAGWFRPVECLFSSRRMSAFVPRFLEL